MGGRGRTGGPAHRLAVGVALLWLAGCAGTAFEADGGGADAGPVDAGRGGGDAGATDAGGADAGSVDAGDPGGDAGVPAGLLDPLHTTTWNPGILADGLLHLPLGDDGLPVRTTVCRTLGPAQAAQLQPALDACDAGTVVLLEAGQFSLPRTVRVPGGVVLRGQGSAGAGATVLSLASGDGPVVAIGVEGAYDQVCYADHFDAPVLLAADAVKEQATVRVAPGSGFRAGDLAQLEARDDPAVVDEGDCGGAFHRAAGYGITERVEVAAVDGGLLTLTSPLHWTFTTALGSRIARVNGPVSRWAGVEHLWLQRGRGLGEYLGRRAGGVDVSNAAYAWVKDVQTDGTTDGMHVALTGTYRCVVRDSHLHNSRVYGFGQDNYGLVLRCGAADNLVENNIVRYLNKPILFNTSGGGNVVGYNYADNAWSLDASGGGAWQEVSIDCHCAHPHMELLEGNWAPHQGASITHGNASHLTWFRNYASSQQAPGPVVWSSATTVQTGNVAALQLDPGDHHLTVVGNVLGSTSSSGLGVPASLGTATVSQAYQASDGTPAILAVGGPGDVSVTTLWWHGNFDTVSGQVRWNPAIATRTLPASLYRSGQPRWWPPGLRWPWLGPDLTPMVGTLPAQAASAAFDYATANDPPCVVDQAAYSCTAP